MTDIVRCTSCAAKIVWVETESGKRMPLDAGPNATGNVIAVGHTGDTMIVKVGTTVELDNAAPERRYQTHFATCPNADRHRRHSPYSRRRTRIR